MQLEQAREVDLIERDAEVALCGMKSTLSSQEGKLGRLGAVTRAEAQVMRLACIYALLDGTATVAIEHLKAGLAVWRYCEDSARFIFGDSLGNAVADRILGAFLRARGTGGMTRTEISKLFQGNEPKSSIEQALTVLNKTDCAIRASHGESGTTSTHRAVDCSLRCLDHSLISVSSFISYFVPGRCLASLKKVLPVRTTQYERYETN